MESIISSYGRLFTRFVIQRYIGNFIRTELNADQLEFQLAKDLSLSVQSVNLNTESINEKLEQFGLVSLIDGYVRQISVQVPYKNPLGEATKIEVKGLELTLLPLTDLSKFNPQELVTSMIGSSCMELARSLITDEDIVSGTDNASVEKWATVLNQYMTKIKVILEDITIRIESHSELCTGLEIHIDRAEFLDELLDSQEQQENFAGEAITQQPGSLYTAKDINKILHVQGVKLYADMWSESERLSTSHMQQSGVEMDTTNSAETSLTGSQFQSCYSHFNRSFHRPHPSCLVPTNPVLFAQLFSEKHTIKLRVYDAKLQPCNDASMYNKRVDVEVLVGGPLYFFLSPSQITLLKDLLMKLAPKCNDQASTTFISSLGGHPMRSEHFQKITDQIQGDLAWPGRSPPGGFSADPWSGAEQFFDLSLDSKNGENSSTLPSNDRLISSYSRNTPSVASVTTLTEKKPDIFNFTLRAPQIIGVITHKDPLSVSEVKTRLDESTSSEFVAIRNTINEMVETSNEFFNFTNDLNAKKISLVEKRKLLDGLYTGDQLRLSTSKAVIGLTLVNDSQNVSVDFSGHLDDLNLLEALVDENDKDRLQNFGILDVESKESSPNETLNFRIRNSLEHPNEYSLEINAEECHLDLDPSIVDRISNLLLNQPSFSQYTHSPSPAAVERNEVSGLRDNILSIHNNSPTYFRLNKFFCRKMLMELRIPIADLSDNAPSYRIRSLHPEYLKFQMESVSFEVPRFKLSDLFTHGVFNLQFRSLAGSFIGDPVRLDCKSDEMRFLFAHADTKKVLSDNSTCKINLEYDTRNQVLRTSIHNGHPDDSTKSSGNMYGSIFRPREEDQAEGPFSKTNNYYNNDKLIMAGSRSELTDFSDGCIQSSKFSIRMSFPYTALCIPSHTFFEVIYNRMANDLALWQPRSPLLRPARKSSDPVVRPFQFTECKLYDDPEESRYTSSFDEYGEYSDLAGSPKRSYANAFSDKHRNSSNIFSIDLEIDHAKVLLQTAVKLDEDKDAKFISQVVTDFADMKFFFVYGFDQDPNLSYSFITSNKAVLYHRNLIGGVQGFSTNVTDLQNFAMRQQKDVFAEDVPQDQPCKRLNEDNFTISVKISYRLDENFRDVLLAISLRNTLLHSHLYTNKNLFWGTQFTHYFTVEDYGVPGYVLPDSKLNANLNLKSVLIGYDHSCTAPHSTMQLRLEIGSCDISTVLMKEMERFKINCMFEDTTLWMNNQKQQNSVSFGGQQRPAGVPQNSYVKTVLVGFLRFTVMMANPGNYIGPEFELDCVNDLITVWLCSDTFTELVNLVSQILKSEAVSSISERERDREDTESRKPAATHSSIHSDEEKRLQEAIQNAMADVASAVTQNKQKVGGSRRNYLFPVFDEDEPPSSADTTTSENTDDEFILIEKIPAKHPACSNNNKLLEPDFEMVSKNVKLPSIGHETDSMHGFIAERPIPRIRYNINKVSFCFYLFAGNDFGTSFGAQKTYSQWETRKDSDECVQCKSIGGRFRDQTVCVETRLTKLQFLWETYNPTSPILSFGTLNLGDIEVTDHLLNSNINKMIYRMVSTEKPKQIQKPIFSLQIIDEKEVGSKLKISMMPLRLNLDLDTVDFLSDFYTALSQSIAHLMPCEDLSQMHGAPVMEIPKIPKEETKRQTTPLVETTAAVPIPIPIRATKLGDQKICFNDLKSKDELNDLFSEDDVLITDSFCDQLRNQKIASDSDSDSVEIEDKHAFERSSIDDSSDAEDGGHALQRSADSIETQHADEMIATNEFNQNLLIDDQHMQKTENAIIEAIEEDPIVSDPNPTSLITQEAQPIKCPTGGSFYFKEVVFSPACPIRLDFNGKMKTGNGVIGLLMGLAHLHKTEVVLKELHNMGGFDDFERLRNYIFGEWYNDIMKNQIVGVLGSYQPIVEITNIGQGLRDLFALPIEEMGRKDGNIVRGIQGGASSFTYSATSAALDVTQRLAGLVQGVAEFAFDVVTPDYAFHRQKRLLAANPSVKMASDFREGLTMAYDTFKEGIHDTVQTLHAAMEEDRACGGQWGMGILRHMTPSAIKPVVIVSRAAAQVLGGLKNQIRPDDFREEKEKWRQATRTLSTTQLRRLPSSGSLLHSQQPYSSSVPNEHFEYHPGTSQQR